MCPTHDPPARTSVDDYLRAFEAAWSDGRRPELGEFLPAAGHSLYGEVLRELVRIDLELGWRAGQPRPVEDYLGRHPQLRDDPHSLREVAFEEYRQRWLAGQRPEAAEYAARFGVATDDWEYAAPATTAPLPIDDPSFMVGAPGAPPPPGLVIPGGRTLAPAPADRETVDLPALLRGRLRLTGLACTLFFGYFAALVLLSPSSADKVGFSLRPGWEAALNGLALAACGGLTARLWSGGPIPLSRLRAAELALFGMVLAYLLGSFAVDLLVEHELAWPLAQGDHALFHYGSSWSLPFFALIVAYGVLVPSTFRRCAGVVGAMALLPLAVAAAAGVAEGAFTASFVQSFLLQMALWLSAAAAIAVYGSHRLEALRREASAARQLGQYRLKRRLGAGGMGEVYLAEHVLLRRPCAIKVIRPDRAADPAARRRFEREVQVMATLRHPNTVQIYDYGHTPDGTFYYVMEYIPGVNLEQLVARLGPLPPARAVHLLSQVCGALAELHAAGLVHRDVKPSNIMTFQQAGLCDVAKLLDFGLVGVPDGGDRLTGVQEVAGTPAYMSPEQAAGKEGLGARTDVYSLGAVAYFLLTGRPPFVRPSSLETLAAHLREPAQAPGCFRAGLPADLQGVILRCLEKAPEARPDAAGLERALAHCDCAGR